MKFLVTFVCTNCVQNKYCGGLHEVEAEHFNAAAKNTCDAIAAACGIEDNKIQIKMIEQLGDNPLVPPPA